MQNFNPELPESDQEREDNAKAWRQTRAGSWSPVDETLLEDESALLDFEAGELSADLHEQTLAEIEEMAAEDARARKPSRHDRLAAAFTAVSEAWGEIVAVERLIAEKRPVGKPLDLGHLLPAQQAIGGQ